MKLNTLKPSEGAVRSPKRVGRGPGSGHGGRSGRGNKGQNARSGGGVRPGFEGGQTPLYQRLPKKGFGNGPFRVRYQVVNLEEIARKGLEGTLDPERMKAEGLIRSTRRPVKVLGDGEIDVPLVIRAHKFSRSALEKIERAGGRAEVIKC